MTTKADAESTVIENVIQMTEDPELSMDTLLQVVTVMAEKGTESRQAAGTNVTSKGKHQHLELKVVNAFHIAVEWEMPKTSDAVMMKEERAAAQDKIIGIEALYKAAATALRLNDGLLKQMEQNMTRLMQEKNAVVVRISYSEVFETGLFADTGAGAKQFTTIDDMGADAMKATLADIDM